MVTFAAIDIETADRDPLTACAIAIVRVEAGVIVARASTLVRPRVPCAWRFASTHGITADHVARGAPEIREAWLEVLAPLLVTGAGQPVDLIAAHNASFDRRVLAALLRAAALAPPAARWCDTLAMAKVAWRDRSCYTLTRAAEYAGLPRFRAHDALEDATACAGLVIVAARSGWRADDARWRLPPVVGSWHIDPTEARRPA